MVTQIERTSLQATMEKTITYNAIGNPLTYDRYTYTREMGRQLKGISGNSKDDIIIAWIKM